MRLAIVDDDELFAKKVENLILQESHKNHYDFQVITYDNGRMFCASLEDEQTADVYFLDIEIGDRTGLELAKRIRAVDENAYIIFLTSHEEFALSGYAYHAYSYMLKEQWKKQMPQVLKEIWESEGRRMDRLYRIQSDRRYDTIFLNDILYIEKDAKNALFHCVNGRVYQERCAVSEVYRRLPAREFAFVNRSQIVNIRCITHLDASTVVLGEDICLEVSRNLLGDIRKRILDYWRK